MCIFSVCSSKQHRHSREGDHGEEEDDNGSKGDDDDGAAVAAQPLLSSYAECESAIAITRPAG